MLTSHEQNGAWNDDDSLRQGQPTEVRLSAKTGRRLSGTKRGVKRGVGLDFADLNQLASLFFGEEFDISP